MLAAAELGLRARIEGLRRRDVRDALWKGRSILKTWCMRGTLHLLASADLPTYVAALRTKLSDMEAWLERSQGIPRSDVRAATSEVELALAHDTLTREELVDRVVRRARLGPQTAKALSSGWGILLRPAAYQGALVFGPNTGPKVTFQSPRLRGAKGNRVSTEEAFEELFRRYLRCYGPSDVREFSRWWGSLPREEAVRLKGRHLGVEVEVEGREALMIESDAEAAAAMDATDVVRLLPSFDSYVMFYSPREGLVGESDRGRIFRKEAGWVSPCVVVGGAAAGTWELKRRTSRVEVQVKAFRPLRGSERRGVEEEVEDIGRFLEVPASVKL